MRPWRSGDRLLRLRALSRPARTAARPDRASPPTTARNWRAPRRRWSKAAAGRRRRRRLRRRSRRLRHGGGRLRGDRGRPGRHGATSTLTIVPGVTAMLAVAARVGAPLGHDFCAISLSDNLKPWDLIERRLVAAAGAGFVIALYNPISKARPWQLGRAFDMPARRSCRQRRRSSSAAPPAGRTSASRCCRWPRPMPRRPTWRPASSSARRKRGSSSARAKPPLVYTPRSRQAGGERQMIDDRGQARRSSARPRRRSAGRAADHDDLDAKRARGGDLAIGGIAAAVLGDDRRRCGAAGAGRARRASAKGPRASTATAPGSMSGLDGFDAADEIAMLRRGLESARPPAGRCDRKTVRRGAQGLRRHPPCCRPAFQRSPSTRCQRRAPQARSARPCEAALAAALAEMRAA